MQFSCPRIDTTYHTSALGYPVTHMGLADETQKICAFLEQQKLYITSKMLDICVHQNHSFNVLDYKYCSGIHYSYTVFIMTYSVTYVLTLVSCE